VDAGGLGSVDVLAVHFKSNRGLPLRDAGGREIPPTTEREYAEAGLRSFVWRAAEALYVRGLVDALLAANPARHVAVAGDLNDHPGSHVVRIVTGGGASPLTRCADVIPEEGRYSTLRRGARNQIDHVLVTAGLAERIERAAFLNEELRDHSELDPEIVPTVDSDHAALVVSFRC
jgi:endonuclease/exonuclease/phosphatase family metal-dependent hydrolase